MSHKKSRTNRKKTRSNKKVRRNTRKIRGGSMVMPLHSIPPRNNYADGDPQRETINSRNL